MSSAIGQQRMSKSVEVLRIEKLDQAPAPWDKWLNVAYLTSDS